MIKKVVNIFTYYDSEPLELILGFIWAILFPTISTLSLGFKLYLVIPSVLLGLALVKSTCIHNLRVRKSLAYGSFIFSVFVNIYLCLSGVMINPFAWIWLTTIMMSGIILYQITKHYYRKKNNAELR